MRPSRRHVLRAGLLGGLGSMLAGDATRLVPRRRLGHAFGTTVAVTLAAAGGREGEAALDAAFAEIRAVERSASLFEPASELVRLNATSRLDDPSPALLDLLALAARLHAQSDGAFDCTIQPLWRCYADALAQGRLPDAGQRAAALARVGAAALETGPRAVRLGGPGYGVTLNALVQGYAADRVSAALRGFAVADALIDTGELGLMGHRPDGRDWRVLLVEAGRRQASFPAARSAPLFVATSADSELSFTADHRLHHILDPRTGISPPELAATTVTAPSGLLADGLSTTLMLVGAERGAVLLRAFPGTAALLTFKDRSELVLGDFPDRPAAADGAA